MFFWKPYLAWSAIGLVGVLFLSLATDTGMISQTPGMGDMSPLALRLMAAIQPAALVLIGTALGVHVAHQIGFRSWLTEKLRGEDMRFPSPVLPLIVGLLLGFVVAIVDIAFFRLVEGAWPEQASQGVVDRLMAVTYGGISEELMMRYGLLSFLIWIAAKVDGVARPGNGLVWTMIVVVALLFGAGHLPVMAQFAELTGPIILRTIGLNAALALFLGWLYWKRGLEAAMMAHIAFHPGLWIGLLLVA